MICHFSTFFTLHFFTNKIGCYNVFNISILVKFFTLISIYNNIKLGGIMKKRKIIFILVIIFTFLLMFILNTNTLFVSDDYPYHYIFKSRTPNSNSLLITNPLQIFESMASHWNIWGGRVVVHFLLQFCFMIGSNFFNIVNSLMFVLLGIIIYMHRKKVKDYDFLLLTFIYCLMFLFIPQPGSTIMWKSGSANYLWASVLLFGMSLLYKRNYESDNSGDSWYRVLLFFLYGLVCGCLNENSSCSLILLEIIYIILYQLKKYELPKWAIFGLIGTIIGYTFLLVAPGNFVRADVMYPAKDYSVSGLFKDLMSLTYLSYSYLKIIIIISVVSFFLLVKSCNNIKDLFFKYYNQVIFFIFALSSIYSLILSPAYPERCWFFAFISLVIFTVINISSLDMKNIKYKKIFCILTCVLIFNTFGEYGLAYNNIIESRVQLDEQITEIKKQIANGKKNIVVHSVIDHSGRYNAFTENGYLTSSKSSWFNKWMAKYYNVDSIVAVD